MFTIWLLTAVAFLYGIGSGSISSTAPQAVSALKLSSLALGFVGAGVPAGYGASCLVCGRIFAGMSAKRVLIGGACGATLALLLMSFARSSAVLVAAQLLYGMSGGAVWPFISSWLLEFEATGVPKQRLLRHYNVSWTSGSAVGMLLGGMICQQGWIFESFQVSAGTTLIAILLATCAREPLAHGKLLPVPLEPLSSPPPPSESTRHARVTRSALIAAVLFNFTAIGTKMVIAVNYAPLNAAHAGPRGGASRMGLLIAVGLISQLLSFSAGKVYEPYLGLRRVYVFGALALAAVHLTFVYTTSLPALIAAEALAGFVLALAFQCAMLAFTYRSSTPRGGTTLMEATVGGAGLAPLAAGALSQILITAGSETMPALRAPFLASVAVIAVVLVIQWLLVPAQREQRRLMVGPA